MIRRYVHLQMNFIRLWFTADVLIVWHFDVKIKNQLLK